MRKKATGKIWKYIHSACSPVPCYPTLSLIHQLQIISPMTIILDCTLLYYTNPMQYNRLTEGTPPSKLDWHNY